MAEAMRVPDDRNAALIANLRAGHPGLTDEAIIAVLRAFLPQVQAGHADAAPSFISAIEDLAETIASTKAEIAALSMDDITGEHIPNASDELDAIVEHTAVATDQILSVCEALDSIAGKLDGEAQSGLQDATTRIYEACSFQDITGQRITKVVGALKAIESKVAHIVYAFGYTREAPPPPPPPGNVLLNGPQLPANAMDQADIDKLLSGMD